MINKKLVFVFAIMLLRTTLFAQQPVVSDDVAKLLKAVSAENIKSHIAFLSDDKLLGRLPGTKGYDQAVDYVIGQLKANHIEPAGENGSYLQKVRIRRASASSVSLSVKIKGASEAPELNKDYIVYPHFEEKTSSVEAQVVFAGFGISAPELNYDDYAKIDVKGKIVLVLRGAPKAFAPHIALNRMEITRILQTAADHGAVGVLLGSATPALRQVTSVTGTMLPSGKVASSGSYISSSIKLYAAINPALVNRFLQSVGLDTAASFASIREGKPACKLLDVQVKAQYASVYTDAETANVVGKITGSDPVLKNEFVVHSAHLDHVGVGRPVDGDSIYNGAHDNASGVASLIEIGKIYASLKVKPKRTVIVTFVTGEEMGMLGSGYYTKAPTVDPKKIVADINTDMPTIIAPFLSAVAIGAEHSTMSHYVDKAGKYLNIDIEKDPEPEQNRFVRSDQYSFVKAGIPAVHVKYGNKTADGNHNLDIKVKAWREKYYHKPQDDINGIFDFEAGKTYVQFNFLISYFIAQDSQRPSWNADSPFAPRAD